jgi:hypothetical protein
MMEADASVTASQADEAAATGRSLSLHAAAKRATGVCERYATGSP